MPSRRRFGITQPAPRHYVSDKDLIDFKGFYSSERFTDTFALHPCWLLIVSEGTDDDDDAKGKTPTQKEADVDFLRLPSAAMVTLSYVSPSIVDDPSHVIGLTATDNVPPTSASDPTSRPSSSLPVAPARSARPTTTLPNPDPANKGGDGGSTGEKDTRKRKHDAVSPGSTEDPHEIASDGRDRTRGAQSSDKRVKVVEDSGTVGDDREGKASTSSRNEQVVGADHEQRPEESDEDEADSVDRGVQSADGDWTEETAEEGNQQNDVEDEDIGDNEDSDESENDGIVDQGLHNRSVRFVQLPPPKPKSSKKAKSRSAKPRPSSSLVSEQEASWPPRPVLQSILKGRVVSKNFLDAFRQVIAISRRWQDNPALARYLPILRDLPVLETMPKDKSASSSKGKSKGREGSGNSNEELSAVLQTGEWWLTRGEIPQKDVLGSLESSQGSNGEHKYLGAHEVWSVNKIAQVARAGWAELRKGSAPGSGHRREGVITNGFYDPHMFPGEQGDASFLPEFPQLNDVLDEAHSDGECLPGYNDPVYRLASTLAVQGFRQHRCMGMAVFLTHRMGAPIIVHTIANKHLDKFKAFVDAWCTHDDDDALGGACCFRGLISHPDELAAAGIPVTVATLGVAPPNSPSPTSGMETLLVEPGALIQIMPVGPTIWEERACFTPEWDRNIRPGWKLCDAHELYEYKEIASAARSLLRTHGIELEAFFDREETDWGNTDTSLIL